MTHPAAALATEDERWAAIQARDSRADGAFVFAVVTTGIYCRPSCPARHAKRTNIRFYPDCAAAEAAGFRACKRCTPDGEALAQRHAAAVRRACDLIEASEAPPRLAALAEAAGLSPFHFHRVFKHATGVTPADYAAARRVERLKAELAEGQPVAQAIYGAGYGSGSRVYESAGAMLGMTPARYARGGQGEAIRWAVAPSPLGPLLVAATARGVCAIEFGEDAEALRARLAKRFPKAEIGPDDGALAPWIAAVAAYLDRPSGGLDLPLDIAGTAFQRRVWRALQDIPIGQTLSYAEVAARLGQPKAVRAVARACASNAVALAIPCHRVVGKDGTLTGYRWGVERKRALLEGESPATSTETAPEPVEGAKRRA
ncbi:MAG TPA: bifunctional DNA-binding transcriptional regulator/O6-methylguanine-DNA methyltransferase Ada [Alphaproteobacteria bacterium]|nr:bifunctional DNA-binding transcriptional regulator/O6-methylguanine-DNA methyltransferase Ada [Alphaproteobacteria bacterium]